MIHRIALLLVATPALADPVIPVFTDETATSGITTAYQGEWEFMVGGGVSTFDCSGDGFPEAFISGGAEPSALYLNRSTKGGPLTFAKADAAFPAGITGAYPLDIDSDGTLDLVTLRVGPDLLLRGLGDCRFEDATAAWDFEGGDAWSTAFAATWEKGQSWPTLAIGTYIDRKEEAFPWGSCTDNHLYRPEGEGYGPPTPLTPSFCALSMIFTDWNRTGQPALRVSNDREYYKAGREQLWRLDPGQPPREYTEKEGWKRLRIWGMGIASADITLDGYPDFYLTSMADNKFQTLATPEPGTKPVYSDLAFARGITAHRPYMGDDLKPSTAWHPQFADVNNDGRLDLFVAKGNVAKMPDFAAADPNNLLLQNDDGTFTEAGDKAGVASVKTGRGAQVVDFNLDGALDLVVVNRWEGAEIWRRDANLEGAWVQVRLDQPGPNRNAIGAVIEVRRGEAVERHEITSGGGHMSGSVGWLHFGLGAKDAAEMRVIWPDGSEGPWQTLPSRAFYTLSPGSEPVVWQP